MLPITEHINVSSIKLYPTDPHTNGPLYTARDNVQMNFRGIGLLASYFQATWSISHIESIFTYLLEINIELLVNTSSTCTFKLRSKLSSNLWDIIP